MTHLNVIGDTSDRWLAVKVRVPAAKHFNHQRSAASRPDRIDRQVARLKQGVINRVSVIKLLTLALDGFLICLLVQPRTAHHNRRRPSKRFVRPSVGLHMA